MGVAAGLCWLALTYGPATLAFGGAFFILTASAMFAPASIVKASTAVSGWATGSAAFLWRLAADHLARSVHRNAITVAALAIAFAMMTGLTVMIHSFRNSVSAWVDGGIVADLFIAPASNEVIGLNATIPEEALRWLRSQREVESVDTFREQPITIVETGGRKGRALLAIVGRGRIGGIPIFRRRRRASLRGGCDCRDGEFPANGKCTQASRSLSATPTGPRSFPVVGVC